MKALKMTMKLRDRWVKALRSGRYKQRKGSLKTADMYGSNARYCCLGVLLTTARTKMVSMPHNRMLYAYEGVHGKNSGTLNKDKRRELGLLQRHCQVLMHMNDGKGKNFNEIADWIEKNVPVHTS